MGGFIFNPIVTSGFQKKQDVFKGQIIVQMEDGTEINITDFIENITFAVETNKENISGKVDKLQGKANNGKILAIGQDGYVVPQSLYTEDGYQPFTKAEKEKLATLPTIYGIDIVNTTSGYLKSYQFYRLNGKNKEYLGAKIDIPQDFFLKEVSKVVVSPEAPISGLTDGTYFKFVFVVEGGAEEVSYQRLDEIVASVSAGEHIVITDTFDVSAKGFVPQYDNFDDVLDSENFFQYTGEFDGTHHKGYFYERTEDGWIQRDVQPSHGDGKDVTLSDDFNIPQSHVNPTAGMTLDNAVGNVVSYAISNDKRISELEKKRADIEESRLYHHSITVEDLSANNYQFFCDHYSSTKESYANISKSELAKIIGYQKYLPCTNAKYNGYGEPYALAFSGGSCIVRTYNRTYNSNYYEPLLNFKIYDSVKEIGSVLTLITGLTQVASFSGYTPKSIGECVQYVGSEEEYEKYAFYAWNGNVWNKVDMGGSIDPKIVEDVEEIKEDVDALKQKKHVFYTSDFSTFNEPGDDIIVQYTGETNDSFQHGKTYEKVNILMPSFISKIVKYEGSHEISIKQPLESGIVDFDCYLDGRTYYKATYYISSRGTSEDVLCVFDSYNGICEKCWVIRLDNSVNIVKRFKSESWNYAFDAEIYFKGWQEIYFNSIKSSLEKIEIQDECIVSGTLPNITDNSKVVIGAGFSPMSGVTIKDNIFEITRSGGVIASGEVVAYKPMTGRPPVSPHYLSKKLTLADVAVNGQVLLLNKDREAVTLTIKELSDLTNHYCETIDELQGILDRGEAIEGVNYMVFDGNILTPSAETQALNKTIICSN